MLTNDSSTTGSPSWKQADPPKYSLTSLARLRFLEMQTRTNLKLTVYSTGIYRPFARHAR
jgi:hypothetical protein